MKPSAILSMLLTATAVLLTACPATSVRFPPDLRQDRWDAEPEPQPWEGERDGSVDFATTDCVDEGDWWLEVVTAGAAQRMDVFLVDPETEAVERHPATLIGFDPAGWGDDYALGPLPGGTPTYRPGESSGLVCQLDPHFAIVTYDRLDAVIDCVVAGPDPWTVQQTIEALFVDVRCRIP